MNPIDPEKPLCRKTDVVGADVPDGYVLLDLDNSKYLQLNATASIVWELLESPMSFRMLTEHLQARFEVEAERCAVEVDALLQRFLKLQIIAYQG